MTISPAVADDDDGGEESHKAPDMHHLASKPPLPRAHKDFSKFRYRPAGDKVLEQADANRLLFWTPDGKPDGYAERRGSSIIYYDAQGKAIRVQRLEASEMND
ncbi:hypothetical protein AD949_07040 [Acetobacter orleanensis]|nr:hypothetical protein AD949_07040 [Acetobacter orleanensis]PCD80162.1 hypothetical protein CO710_03235 [Acetobacter orleanensis]